MDATCTIQDSIHVFNLVHKYVSRILGTYQKQAGWVESGGTGESPQPEVAEKQVGWVENGRAGENPQPEGKEKQAGWVESGRARETPQPEATRSSAR